MNLLPRLHHSVALLIFCAFALAPLGAAHALPIAIAEQQRSVAGEAAASSSAANDADSNGDQTPLPGPASLSTGALANVAGVNAAGGARQQGDVSTLQLAVMGDTSSTVEAIASGGFALASAETQARIVFTATADSVLRLTGRVAALGGGQGDASALIELAAVDSTLDPLLLIFQVGPGDEIDIDAIAMLHAGIEYRLLALARSNADALGGELAIFASMFRFTLAEVPEPGTALTLALGLALLTKLRPTSHLYQPTPPPHRPA
jgi:hypothetical protein